MARAIDEPIPPEEELFRTIASANRDGELVLPGAIDPDGTSFYRQKYCAFEDVPCSDEEPLIAVLLAGGLPASFASAGGVSWEFFLVDDPDGHVAHSEVRFRRVGNTSRECERPKRGVRDLIRAHLAKCLRVRERPEPQPAPVHSNG